jgi:thiosulfate/3-mercaptopyruvate sulfurtransferase
MPHDLLITAPELRRHLEDPNWAIFDCGFDLQDPGSGERAYLKSHIPGAAYVHLERDLSATRNGRNGRHPLPDDRALAALFSHLGISPQTQVIAYDTSCGPYAARLWWSLRYMGHEHVALLDGGLDIWREREFPESAGPESRPEAAFTPHPRPEMIAREGEIREQLGTGRIFLLDARSGERFRGEAEPYDPVAGRIPGAENRFWKDNLDLEGHFRSPQALRREFEGILGETPIDRIVSYCGSGVTAAHNLLAMACAGLEGARLYPGSWSEWCARPDNPIARGE